MYYGDFFNISCNNGFTRASTNRSRDTNFDFLATCTDSGTLSNYDEQCVPIQCPTSDYGDANGVWTNVTTLPYGSRINVTCNAGFRSDSGVGNTTCPEPNQYQASCLGKYGEFLSDKICTVISCPVELVPSTDIGVEYISDVTSILFNESITVGCLLGYRPLGKSIEESRVGGAACLQDCSLMRPFCTPIQTIQECQIDPNAQSAVGDFPRKLIYADPVSITCNSGYVVTGTTTCQDNWTISATFDGNCSGTETTCEPITCTANADPDGLWADAPTDAASRSAPHGSTLTVMCNSGYRPSLYGAPIDCSEVMLSYDLTCGSGTTQCTFDEGYQCTRCTKVPCPVYSVSFCSANCF